MSVKNMGLGTLVDGELARMGPRVASGLAARDARLAAETPAGTIPGAEAAATSGLALKVLQEHNPDHLGTYWEDCEALYRGGHHLLRNDQLMARIFPAHNAELPTIYADRKARAVYINYSGKIVDMLVAALEADPLRLVAESEDEDSEGEVPAWWADWVCEVTAPGAALEHKFSLHGFVCEVLRRAQVKRDSWILVDLPRVAPDVAAAVDSILDQERLGLTEPYVCLVDASEVTDWDMDDDGTLLWVCRHTSSNRRQRPGAGRGAVVHTWTIWDASGWAVYQLAVDPRQPPTPDTIVPLVDQGDHPFGVVPWIRFSLPDGLWTMGKLESPAREHFNKRSALSWAEFKSLFAVLYEFLATGTNGPVTVGRPAGSDDPHRATNQIRGQGWTQRRGEKDRAEYVGPDPGPFGEARESCAEMMQEMHRVTSTMAASANMDSGALQRSADSKRDDRTDEQKVLEAFGMRGRELASAIIDLVAAGRGEAPPAGVTAQGLEAFDTEAISTKITDAVALFAGVPVLSPTFKRLVLGKLYQAIMSDDATPENLEAMRSELRTAIEAEGVMLGLGPGGVGGLGGGALPPQPPGEGDPEDDEDDEPKDKPAPGKPPAGPRVIAGGGPRPPRGAKK